MSDPSAKPFAAAIGADTRIAELRAYLAAKSSPLAEEADVFVSEADRLNLDWRLVAAIAGVESTFGAYIPTNSYNAWGWGVFTGANDGIHFTSWSDGIRQVSEGIKFRYIDRGARNIDQIGRIYASSPTWSAKVKFMIYDIDRFRTRSSETLAVTI